MVHVLRSSQLLSGGVDGGVVVHTGSEVKPSREVLEAVQAVPLANASSAGVMVDNLGQTEGAQQCRLDDAEIDIFLPTGATVEHAYSSTLYSKYLI